MKMSLSWKVINGKDHFTFDTTNSDSSHLVYSKKVQAQAHNPTQVLDLKKCNYVGLKIPVRALGQQETFEFVVSLENCEVVTFSAKTW